MKKWVAAVASGVVLAGIGGLVYWQWDPIWSFVFSPIGGIVAKILLTGKALKVAVGVAFAVGAGVVAVRKKLGRGEPETEVAPPVFGPPEVAPERTTQESAAVEGRAATQEIGAQEGVAAGAWAAAHERSTQGPLAEQEDPATQERPAAPAWPVAPAVSAWPVAPGVAPAVSAWPSAPGVAPAAPAWPSAPGVAAAVSAGASEGPQSAPVPVPPPAAPRTGG